MAHLLANDKLYIGVPMNGKTTIRDFRSTLAEARKELSAILAQNCGASVEICAAEDMGRFNNEQANRAFYDSTQTYDLPVVYDRFSKAPVDVGEVAPEAGYLLTEAYSSLSLKQADKILTETEGPGGGFLDDGSDPSFAVYARLNLYRASQTAASISSVNKQ